MKARICRKCGATESRHWNCNECWECQKERVREWKRKNRGKTPGTIRERESAKESRRRRYAEDPEYRARINAASNAWHAADRVGVNRGRYLARSRINVQRYQARLLNAPGDGVSRVQWEAIKAAQGGCCFDCGKATKLTVGHLMPLIHGGAHDVTNVVGQCERCNKSQGAKIHPSIIPAA